MFSKSTASRALLNPLTFPSELIWAFMKKTDRLEFMQIKTKTIFVRRRMLCVCLGSYQEGACYAKNIKPCCSSPSTLNNNNNNINNSKLTARSQPTSCAQKGQNSLGITAGRWCDFNKQQAERGRDVGMSRSDSQEFHCTECQKKKASPQQVPCRKYWILLQEIHTWCYLWVRRGEYVDKAESAWPWCSHVFYNLSIEPHKTGKSGAHTFTVILLDR